jgi:hypothetical protein
MVKYLLKFGISNKGTTSNLKYQKAQMELKIFATGWGYDYLTQLEFLEKMRLAGYDGFDMWLPNDSTRRKELFDYLQHHQMPIIVQQHQAAGDTFEQFKEEFIANLYNCAEADPLFINSHTGRDYFTFEQNLELFDAAFEFTGKTGITVMHETHRKRALYAPGPANEYFKAREQLRITADFSHWVCVTESMLDGFTGIMQEAIKRTGHIHSRVGFEEGPQVSHPGAPEWDYALQKFLTWWDQIAGSYQQQNSKYFTITTEFGPQPYMPSIPFTNEPVASQFEVNCFMKDLVRERYSAPINH